MKASKPANSWTSPNGWRKGEPKGLVLTSDSSTEGAQDAWRAILRRDRLYDGRFVYAATTTGLYCRPSCPARHPRRQNTVFFPGAERAEEAGFAACSRCCPGANRLSHAERCVKEALLFIEEHFDQKVSLAELSRRTGFHAKHFREVFQRFVGLTPREYANARRLARFKEGLRAGVPILEAGYAVGYGSSRAIYEHAKKALGMTPADYRRGGDGVTMKYAIAPGGNGSLLVAATKRGVCSVALGKSEQLAKGLRTEFPKAALVARARPWPRLMKIITECRREDPVVSKLPVALRRHIFLAIISVAIGPLV
jgi:AraC family transcriptional regulator of adaptative response/methylated-DNA-[protein]-cysteine methyltransferase